MNFGGFKKCFVETWNRFFLIIEAFNISPQKYACTRLKFREDDKKLILLIPERYKGE